MKTFLITLLLTIIVSLTKAQAFLGKSYSEVHKIFNSYKGDNLYRFIEIDPNSISYGKISNERKQKIYMYSTIFNEDKTCIAELWSDFKTKESAFEKIKKSIGNKKLTYIGYTDKEGDSYMLLDESRVIEIRIIYSNDGYKEYSVSMQYVIH